MTLTAGEEADEWLPTRRSLLTRLKDWDDQEGWREFFETYWKLIYGVARQAGLAPADAEEIVQETIIAVAKKMRHFRYDPEIGSFKAWLLLNVRSRLADHWRRSHCRIPSALRQEEDPARTALAEQVPDPSANRLDALWEEQWQKSIFAAALERVKLRVSARQFQIFDLYALQQVPLKKITATLGVNFGQVYLAKHRVARLIRQEIRRLETRML